MDTSGGVSRVVRKDIFPRVEGDTDGCMQRVAKAVCIAYTLTHHGRCVPQWRANWLYDTHHL